MSSQDQAALDESRFEQEVARYLRDNPDFFERHLALLADMVLPHETGQAISLFERQVAVLRDQRDDYKKKLQQLIQHAKQNEKLNADINSLILDLLDAETLDKVLDIIEQRIRTDFAADAVTVKLLATGNDALKSRPDMSVWKQPALMLAEKVMNNRQPLCGSFKAEQMDAVFGEEGIRSAAVIPLVEEAQSKTCYGVIAIGSHDPYRFGAEMGTHFLSLFGKVLSRILKQHLEE